MITGDYYEQIESWIVSGAVDCGFFRLPSTKHLQTYPLYRDELQVVVPCDHVYAQEDPFPASELAEEPFILLEEGEDYEIMAAFDKLGIRPHVSTLPGRIEPSWLWCPRAWASACCLGLW